MIEDLYFPWSKWKAILPPVLFYSLFCGLIVGLRYGLIVGLRVGLLVGPFYGLIVGLGIILQPKPVSRTSAPNRGTFRSLYHAAILFLVCSALGAVIAVAFPTAFPSLLRVGLVSGFFLLALGLAMLKGGLFTIRHYVVRLLLWRYGVAPLRYVRSLNEAAERLFLNRRGGSYEFFHVTFRDYMADAYGTKKSKL
jgi:hypothetical protein